MADRCRGIIKIATCPRRDVAHLVDSGPSEAAPISRPEESKIVKQCGDEEHVAIQLGESTIPFGKRTAQRPSTIRVVHERVTQVGAAGLRSELCDLRVGWLPPVESASSPRWLSAPPFRSEPVGQHARDLADPSGR